MECKDHVDRKDPKRLISFLTFVRKSKEKEKEDRNGKLFNKKSKKK